jgi:RHS repeat-associated protein
MRPQVESLEDRCLLSGGLDLAFVDTLLRDLARGATPQTVNSRPQHALAVQRQPKVVGSPQAAQVKALYRAYLHQVPAAAQLKQGVALVAAGETLQLQAQILGSASYFSKRAHRKNDRFLAAVAQDVLHHPLDAAHLAQYSALLAHGTSRTTVALLILAPNTTPVDHGQQPRLPTGAIQIIFDSPAPGTVTSHLNLTGHLTGNVPAVASMIWLADDAGGHPAGSGKVTLDGNGAFHFSVDSLSGGDGSDTVTVDAFDPGPTQLLGSATLPFTLDTTPPQIVVRSPAPLQQASTNITVTGQVTDATSGVASLQGQLDGGSPAPVAVDPAGNFHLTTSLALDGSADGPHTLHLVAADRVGNVSTADLGFTLDTQSQHLGAPAVDPTVATTVGAEAQFLYSGSSPVQTGVAPGTIDPLRAAVLRGQVKASDGTPLAGVTISVLNHPEFGSTTTQPFGLFSLAVNGGGLLTVAYAKSGYLPAHRQVQATIQDYAWLPDVTLLPPDAHVNAIDLSAATPMQVARGSVVTDADGTRQATLLFPQGTTATMTLPGGSTQPLTTLHVRLTEFSVGAAGPSAMPADLPAVSAYAYAVDLSADEATAAGATTVTFSQSLPFYVEDFLNLPVGGGLPLGSYDRTSGVWQPLPGGLVVKVLSVTGGMANLDTDGSGQAASAAALSALGISDAERQTLATLYQPGQALWRLPVMHFSDNTVAPSDSAPMDAINVTQSGFGGYSSSLLRNVRTERNTSHDDPTICPGCSINMEDQTLGQDVSVAGTAFTLHYQSERLPGRTANRELLIPLSGGPGAGFSLPADLLRIDLQVSVAGERFVQSFPPDENETFSFTWDGKDAFGRTLQGTWPVEVAIGYVYSGTYGAAPAFGSNAGAMPISGSHTRQNVTLGQDWQTDLTTWDARDQGLGGWTLDVQHSYDPVDHTLYQGDGTVRRADFFGPITQTVAGGGTTLGDGGAATQAALVSPTSVAVAADGSYYVADTGDNRIRRIAPDGIITTVAGTGTAGYNGDSIPATQAELSAPAGVALGPDGSVYVADTGNNRVRRIAPDGTISTVAGTGMAGFGGDGGPAAGAQLNGPASVFVGPDGSLYVADTGNNRVRRIAPDGSISTVAGTGTAGFSGDLGPAVQATLKAPRGVALGHDGSLFIADTGNNAVRRVAPDGVMHVTAGSAADDPSEGTGGPLFTPTGLAVAADGTVYVAQAGQNNVVSLFPDNESAARLGRTIDTTDVAGSTHGFSGFSGDGGTATQALLVHPTGVALGPDGSLYLVDQGNNRVRRLTLSQPGLSTGDFFVPSQDGSQVFLFNHDGRHLKTLDALTGALRFQFGYDTAGHLVTVTDGDGNVTTIQRDAAGNPTAIVAPFGQTTTLTLDANGNLATITDPAGKATQLGYDPRGLLTTLTDPNGGVDSATYDTDGRLIHSVEPDGSSKTLTRQDHTAGLYGDQGGYIVTVTTGLGEQTVYYVGDDPSWSRRVIVMPALNLTTQEQFGQDGSNFEINPDGSVVMWQLGPDPRFGMEAPFIQTMEVASSQEISGIDQARQVTLADPANPLRLVSQVDTRMVNANPPTSQGDVYTTTFDAASRQITTTTPEGRTAVDTLDGKGRLIGSQAPGITPVQYSYDSHGRLATVTQGTRTETFGYDALGNLASITNPLAQTTSFAYDPNGRVTSQTFADGNQVQLGYDANGNVTSITPPGRPAHTFTYTPANQVQSYTPPSVGAGTTTTQNTYDTDGRLVQTTLPDGTATTFNYHGSAGPGLLSSITVPQGQETFSYLQHAHTTGSPSGQVSSITAPGGEQVALTYDDTLLTGTTWSGPVAGAVTRTYDQDPLTFESNFRLASETVNAGSSVNFQYDKDGLLTKAGDLTLSYDPHNGQLTGTALGTVTDSITYDSFGQATGYQASAGSTSLFSVQDTPDALGRVSQRTEIIGGVSHTYGYTYDPAGQLTQVTQDSTVTAQYTYDANGNRPSFTGPGGTVNGTYDNQDRLLSYGTLTYTYKPDGSLATRTDSATNQTTTYSYDALGNLTGVVLADGTRIDYVVDGQGRRVGKKVNGTLVQGFLYDGGRLVAELDGSGNVVSQFVSGSSDVTPDYLIKGGVKYRIIADALGSPRLIVNAATGAVVERIDYDAFGNVTLDTNPGFQPFGFAGGLYDRDTKLTRFGARDYDAQAGRWTAKDPIGFTGGDTNLYRRALNDPINLTDPDGLYVNYVDPDLRGYLELLKQTPSGASLLDYINANPKPVDIVTGNLPDREDLHPVGETSLTPVERVLGTTAPICGSSIRITIDLDKHLDIWGGNGYTSGAAILDTLAHELWHALQLGVSGVTSEPDAYSIGADVAHQAVAKGFFPPPPVLVNPLPTRYTR